MLSTYRKFLVAGALVMVPTQAVLADDDSSADVGGGYTNYVAESTAAVIKVPINAQGEELVNAAELRTYAGEPVASSSTASIKTAFDEGATVADVPTVSDQDISLDSSTSWGWYNWRGNYGYRYNYYNTNYPYYFAYGNYYRYNRPFYYNYYNYNRVGNYYGYRYYYYPRF